MSLYENSPHKWIYPCKIFMKAASINDIKRELERKNNSELTEFCLRLSKFKKENKELLTFLLFEAGNINTYTEAIKLEIIISFEEISNQHIYYVKKSVRKILRQVNKHIRIIGSKQAEAELFIQFCNSLKKLSASILKNKQMTRIYENQLKKIAKAISVLHPDLQYDLNKQLQT